MPEQIATVSRVIDAPIDEVWGLITAWGAERLWMPGCIKSSLKGHGVGAVRSVTVNVGETLTIDDKLEALDPASHTLAYSVLHDTERAKSPSVKLALKEVDGGKTELNWALSVEWVDEAQKTEVSTRLESMYNIGLDSLAGALAPKA